MYCLLRLIVEADVEVEVEMRWDVDDGVMVGLVEDARFDDGATDMLDGINVSDETFLEDSRQIV